MKTCPNCSANLSKANSIKLITEPSIKWYQLAKVPIDRYIECQSCKAQLDEKGTLWRIVPSNIALWLFLFGREHFIPQEASLNYFITSQSTRTSNRWFVAHV